MLPDHLVGPLPSAPAAPRLSRFRRSPDSDPTLIFDKSNTDYNYFINCYNNCNNYD